VEREDGEEVVKRKKGEKELEEGKKDWMKKGKQNIRRRRI
jgi:hypothetical protein